MNHTEIDCEEKSGMIDCVCALNAAKVILFALSRMRAMHHLDALANVLIDAPLARSLRNLRCPVKSRKHE